MINMKFKKFKDNYLKKFRLYYRQEGTNRRELKRSIYDNPKLTEVQKDRFWKLVIE